MSHRYPAPPARRLRVYAFDPQTASRLGSVDYAFATISLPWGTAEQDQVQPGPINDYVEVIDVDPAMRANVWVTQTRPSPPWATPTPATL